MTDQHPIIPSPVLIKQWRDDWFENDQVEYSEYSYLATRAAQWGYQQADQELEACIAWFDTYIPGYELVADRLRAARRPKPPSLKEQALQALGLLIPFIGDEDKRTEADTIRRALEQLND